MSHGEELVSLRERKVQLLKDIDTVIARVSEDAHDDESAGQLISLVYDCCHLMKIDLAQQLEVNEEMVASWIGGASIGEQKSREIFLALREVLKSEMLRVART